MSAEAYCEVVVNARPATFPTAHELPWKAAVREAISVAGIDPRPDARFHVRIVFRTPVPHTVKDRWDLDNLVKPTLDAMEGVFGLRAWRGAPQPNDDKVVKLEATKQTVADGQDQGATITVWLVEESQRALTAAPTLCDQEGPGAIPVRVRLGLAPKARV